MPRIPNKYRGKREYTLAHAALVLAAHSRSFLTYTGIAQLTGLPTRGSEMASKVGHLLGEIGEDDHKAGRPLLCALVVDKETGTPSFGFYTLLDKLKILQKCSKAKQEEFRKKEQTKVFDFWK